MFLQIHTLTSYHASLLNRDDAGLAKRIPFGGAERLRVSSQCLKRHWTDYFRKEVALPRGDRTRHFLDRVIVKRLVEPKNIPGRDAEQLAVFLATVLFAKRKSLNDWKKKGKDAHGIAQKLKSSDTYKQFSADNPWPEKIQAILFGRAEADFFVDLLANAYQSSDKDLDMAAALLVDKAVSEKENFDALLRQAGYGNLIAGFEGALFGRFVTSDLLARVDAPVHVAHAFTTHALDTEVDFFTVVDDLAKDDETGAAHANDTELGAGIFYGYVAVDVPLLVSNLTGCDAKAWKEQDATDARNLLDRLIHAIAEVTPGAKLGATAPYARAEHVMLEVSDAQPRSLANAYLKPVRLNGREHPMTQSVQAMAEHIDALTGMYGDDTKRRTIASIHDWPRQHEQPVPLQEAIDQALKAVFGAAS